MPLPPIRLVAFRGKAMERAAGGRESAMVAVLGLDRVPLQDACPAGSALGTVVIANYNCPGPDGHRRQRAAVEQAALIAKELGAKRTMPLKVSGPFHTPLMAPAGEELADYFQTITFGQPQFPVLFNCLAGPARRTIPPSPNCWSDRSRAAFGWRIPSDPWPTRAWMPSWRSVRAKPSAALSARQYLDSLSVP